MKTKQMKPVHYSRRWRRYIKQLIIQEDYYRLVRDEMKCVELWGKDYIIWKLSK